MATVLAVGDIAIIHYNSTGSDSFFVRLPACGRCGYQHQFHRTTAGRLLAASGPVKARSPTRLSAALRPVTIVTLTGLDLDDAGDQIIAYQGDPATPTILHVVDLADGNTTVAGDATDRQHHGPAAPVHARCQRSRAPIEQFDLRGRSTGSPAELFAAISNSANWIG
jgi:hypothetical protein